MTARRPQADIAILWSQPSLYVAWGMSDRESATSTSPRSACYDQYFVSREAFRKAVVSSGRQFDYVCEDQIRTGVLSRYKCILLPASYALGADVCAALRKFAEQGGTVIADQGVGLANEAGAWCDAAGPAATLLGIQRSDRTLSFEPITVAIPTETGEALELAVKGAKDAGPPLVRKPCGKGSTVYLNFAAQDVPGLSVILSGLSLPPLATIVAEPGAQDPRDVEVVRLDRGDIRYLGLLHDYRNRDPNSPITLRLGDKRHVYDVLAGKYLGQTERVRLDLPPGHTAVLASLGYAVVGVELQAEGRVKAGQPCRLDIALRATKRPGDHVYRIEVRKRGGELAEAYCRNVLSQAGRAALTIPFAPNDPAGEWQVVVRDTVSGRSATQSVELTR